jgi:hypothetical protein
LAICINVEDNSFDADACLRFFLFIVFYLFTFLLLKVLLDRAGQLSLTRAQSVALQSDCEGQCKANAIELARIAEPQPVLANSFANVDIKKRRRKDSSIAVEFV